MDIDSLVQKITSEVVSKLEQEEKVKPAVSKTACAYDNSSGLLVIINSNDKHLDSILNSLRELKNRYSIKILLSKNAAKLLSKDIIQKGTGISDIFIDCNEKIDELYKSCCVVLPNLTLATLSKFANHINDSIVIDILLNAVICSKPVYVCSDFVNYLITMNPVVSTTVNENLDKLRNMGVKIINISQLSGLQVGSYSVPSGQLVNISQNFRDIADAGAARIGSSGLEGIKIPSDTAQLIDHTQLKPDVTKDQIQKLCEEAKTYNFASVCVNPGWVSFCSSLLNGTPVKVATVIGFPLGATTTATKAAETSEAIRNGADEIDMVINIGKLKAGDFDYVRNDIKSVVDAAQGRVVKVIIETALLSDEEKVAACKLAKEANASYVKTSTGFSSGGATMADIALMRSIVGPDMGVKASGGVKTFKDAVNMIEVGASRIGASAGIAIVKGGASTSDY